MKRISVLIFLFFLLSACAPAALTPTPSPTFTLAPTKIATAEPTETFTPAATRTPAATNTPKATSTPRPTKTPVPTSTPLPSVTPSPIPTATPIKTPIVLTGKGDAVVDVNKWTGFALARITYTGGRNFVVKNYDANGERIDLLVNTIGVYSGTKIIDVNSETARFQIESSGNWEIQVLPIDLIRYQKIPSTVDGVGDDVILIGPYPDLLKIDASTAKGNLIIWGIGKNRSLLVNDISPYTGTVIVGKNIPIDSGIMILEVKAVGPWSIQITTRQP